MALTGNEKLHVQTGDHLGFTWWEQGVIEYQDGNDYRKYCQGDLNGGIGDIVTFATSGPGWRTYSMKWSVMCGQSFSFHYLILQH